MRVGYARGILATTLLLGFACSAPAPGRDERTALARVEEYAQTIIDEDRERSLSFFHPDFRSWYYEDSVPIDRDGIPPLIDDYSENYTVLQFDIDPVAIQIHGDLAVVHVWYHEWMRDAQEKGEWYCGRWTITMVPHEGEWSFYSWTWLEQGVYPESEHENERHRQ